MLFTRVSNCDCSFVTILFFCTAFVTVLDIAEIVDKCDHNCGYGFVAILDIVGNCRQGQLQLLFVTILDIREIVNKCGHNCSHSFIATLDIAGNCRYM